MSAFSPPVSFLPQLQNSYGWLHVFKGACTRTASAARGIGIWRHRLYNSSCCRDCTGAGAVLNLQSSIKKRPGSERIFVLIITSEIVTITEPHPILYLCLSPPVPPSLRVPLFSRFFPSHCRSGCRYGNKTKKDAIAVHHQPHPKKSEWPSNLSLLSVRRTWFFLSLSGIIFFSPFFSGLAYFTLF